MEVVNSPSDSEPAKNVVSTETEEEAKASEPTEGSSDASEQDWEAQAAHHKALIVRLEKKAVSPESQAVLKDFEASAQITLMNNEQITALRTFKIGESLVESFLKEHQANMLEKGWYLFRFNRSYGIGGGSDMMGLLPTTDKYEVLEVMQTNGANYDLGPAEIVSWLQRMEERYPFHLTDAGFDYLAGHFLGNIDDPEKLAKDMYEFCPDIVDQGVGEVSALAEQLKKDNPKLYFWWD